MPAPADALGPLIRIATAWPSEQTAKTATDTLAQRIGLLIPIANCQLPIAECTLPRPMVPNNP